MLSMRFPSRIKYGHITVVFVFVAGECLCWLYSALALTAGESGRPALTLVTQQVGPCLNIVSIDFFFTSSIVLIYL